jgi:hypothetical protein
MESEDDEGDVPAVLECVDRRHHLRRQLPAGGTRGWSRRPSRGARRAATKRLLEAAAKAAAYATLSRATSTAMLPCMGVSTT